MTEPRDPEIVVREIKRKTRRKFSSEEKIRILTLGVVLNAGVVHPAMVWISSPDLCILHGNIFGMQSGV